MWVGGGGEKLSAGLLPAVDLQRAPSHAGWEERGFVPTDRSGWPG